MELVDQISLWMCRAITIAIIMAVSYGLFGLACVLFGYVRARLCRHDWETSLPVQRGHALTEEQWIRLQGEHPWDGEYRTCRKCGRRETAWNREWRLAD